jgi:hypothetical protein
LNLNRAGNSSQITEGTMNIASPLEKDPNYVAERGTLNATLNFIIPAGQMLGNIRLRVSVNEATHALSASSDASGRYSAADVTAYRYYGRL